MTVYRALVIDDDQNTIDLFSFLLTKLSIETFVIPSLENVEVSLDQLGETIDVVFLDLEFPNNNGFEALKTLRQHQYIKNAYIIACSAHTHLMTETRVAGFDGFLGKPLHASKFSETLEDILSGKPVWNT